MCYWSHLWLSILYMAYTVFLTFAHSTVHVEDQEEHSGWILPCWQKHDLVAGEWVNLKPQTIYICIKKMKSIFRTIDDFDIIFISVTQKKYALYSVTTKKFLDKNKKSIFRTIDINICHYFHDNWAQLFLFR